MKQFRDFMATPFALVAVVAVLFIVIPFTLLAKIVSGKQ